jgi:tRNA threonylcarbamoyladenosine biosynthesis protein TsaB
MLLLAVDTSGRNGSLALVCADEHSFDVLAMEALEGRMYSAQLIPALQQALERTNLKKSDIDAFAVASGPGSFTGLRVGISTVKALSEVLHKPIAAVSVLEAAVRVTNVDGHVIVALDAGRKQVFIGDRPSNAPIHESLITLEGFFHLAKGSQARLFTPDGAVREAAAAHGLTLDPMAAPQADTFARIGFEKLKAGEISPAETLEANYIRASDAELFSLPKLTS